MKNLIVVLLGGLSGERKISFLTGRACSNALKKNGFNVKELDAKGNFFNKLKKLKPGKDNEIHITDAIQSLIDENEKFIGHNFQGKYLDCGTMGGYINSSLEISKI